MGGLKPLRKYRTRAPVGYEPEIFGAKWLAGVNGGQTGSKCNRNFFGLARGGRSPKLSGRGAARGSGTKTLRATNAYVFVVLCF